MPGSNDGPVDGRAILEREMLGTLASTESGFARFSDFMKERLSAGEEERKEVVEILLSWLDRNDLKISQRGHGQRDLRIDTLITIARFRIEEATPKLLEIAANEDFESDLWLQNTLISIVGELLGKRAVPFLVQQLSRNDLGAGTAAIQLARFDVEEALRHLEEIVAAAQRDQPDTWLKDVIACLLVAEGRSALDKIVVQMASASRGRKELLAEAVAQATDPFSDTNVGFTRQESEDAVSQVKRDLGLS